MRVRTRRGRLASVRGSQRRREEAQLDAARQQRHQEEEEWDRLWEANWKKHRLNVHKVCVLRDAVPPPFGPFCLD